MTTVTLIGENGRVMRHTLPLPAVTQVKVDQGKVRMIAETEVTPVDPAPVVEPVAETKPKRKYTRRAATTTK